MTRSSFLCDDEAAAHVGVERPGHVEEAADVAAEDVVGRVEGPGEAGRHRQEEGDKRSHGLEVGNDIC